MNKYEITSLDGMIDTVEADQMNWGGTNVVTFSVKGPYIPYENFNLDVFPTQEGGYYPWEIVAIFTNVKKAVKVGEST